MNDVDLLMMNGPCCLKLEDWSYDGVDLLINIVAFNINIPEDIELEIYETWTCNGRSYIELKQCSHPLYRDEIIIEKAIDYAFMQFRENKTLN